MGSTGSGLGVGSGTGVGAAATGVTGSGEPSAESSDPSPPPQATSNTVVNTTIERVNKRFAHEEIKKNSVIILGSQGLN